MIHRLHRWATGVAIATALSSPAHAEWKLASTDTPVTVVRAATVTTAATGDTLRDGDLLQSSGEGVVYLQDGRGTLVALGPQTRAMLTADAHVALLNGWLKIAATSCATAPCTPPRVDTERGPFNIGENAAAIITTPENANAIALFSETGTQTFVAKPPLTIPDGQFATIDSPTHLQLSPRPSDAFVTNMPVAFRDALQPLRVPKSSHAASPSRAVTYDDIAPWLASKLPERKTFPARFRPRLTDAAFRRDIETHLKELPDWRPLLYPPKRPGAHRAYYP